MDQPNVRTQTSVVNPSPWNTAWGICQAFGFGNALLMMTDPDVQDALKQRLPARLGMFTSLVLRMMHTTICCNCHAQRALVKSTCSTSVMHAKWHALAAMTNVWNSS